MRTRRLISLGVVLAIAFLAAPCHGDDFLAVLHSFKGGASDGMMPSGDLVVSGSTLYGMTQLGGGKSCGGLGCGTIFAVGTDGSNFRLLHSFGGDASDGANPMGSLTVSGSVLYGMTQDGGSSNEGTIFSINTNGTNFKVLHSFSRSAGAFPSGNLLLTGSTLYGMTSMGGTWDKGVIFSTNTAGTDYTVLHTFAGGSGDGSSGDGSLLLTGSTLYGMTVSGGGGRDSCWGNGCGTIFSMTTKGTGYKLLHAFSPVDGITPMGSLIRSGAILYGMTGAGGASQAGTVFLMDPMVSRLSVMHSFAGAGDGAFPEGSLLLSGSTLYGMTNMGGSYAGGTIFSINTDGSNFKRLHSFNGTDGDSPLGSLVLSGSTLYGMTCRGGGKNYGTIFAMGIDSAKLLSVKVVNSGMGVGRVTSAPAGLDCPGQCGIQVPKGSVITLTPAAGTGSTFTGWSGGGCQGTGTCAVIANSAFTVGATFAVQQFTVTASAPKGHGKVGPVTQKVVYGKSASLSIRADTGYRVASITDNGVAVTPGTSYTIKSVTADHNVIVTFSK